MRRHRKRKNVGRFRRAIRPRGPQPRWGRLFIAVQAVAALVFVAYLLISDGARTPLASRVTLQAEFADAAGLRAENHSPVTVAGVPARIVGEAGCAEPARSMDQILAQKDRG